MRVALTFHVERLSADDVWGQVDRMLSALGRHGVQATFFCVAPVHPYYRNQPGFAEDKWAGRLAEIAGRGHVVGQHTHFYGPEGKKLDVSTDNLHKRLGEDRRWLEVRGFAPAGFVGGAWTINSDVLRFLMAHGYRYDCSARSFSLAYLEGRGQAMVAQHPFWLETGNARLLEIPSTTSLVHLVHNLLPFAWRRTYVDVPCWGRYTLIYLHDYDLLDPRFRAVLYVVLRWYWFWHMEFVTVDALCDALAGTSLLARTLEETEEGNEAR